MTPTLGTPFCSKATLRATANRTVASGFVHKMADKQRKKKRRPLKRQEGKITKIIKNPKEIHGTQGGGVKENPPGRGVRGVILYSYSAPHAL